MADMDTYVRFLVGLLFVLGLILALAWIARRMNLVPGAIKLSKGGPRRLAIVEISAVDAKRRLVLVRRDNVEHLLLLGPTNETVIEIGIKPPETFSNALSADKAANNTGKTS
jgi:flagellar protein FliO/FliZ